MDYEDVRLGQRMTLTGVTRTVTMLDANDAYLPDGVVDITIRVNLKEQVRLGKETEK